MSGLARPARTIIPTPVRPIVTCVPAATLPPLASSSITAGGVMMTTSNGSPASICRFSAPIASYFIASLWLVSPSKRGASSVRMGRKAVEARTVTSAASTAPCVNRTAPNAAAAVSERMLTVTLPSARTASADQELSGAQGVPKPARYAQLAIKHGLAQGLHDMLPKAGAFGQPLVPAPNMRPINSLEIQGQPPVHRRTHGDVAHRKRLTANEPALSEVRIQDRQCLLGFRLGRFQHSRIALLGSRSHQGPEHVSDWPVQGGQLPVHPALGIEAGCEIARAQRAQTVLHCEIAHDRVRLPQNVAIVLEGWDPAVRIESAIRGCLNNAESHTGVDALEWQVQLGAAPQHLLDIDRVLAAPDPEHASPPAITCLVLCHSAKEPGWFQQCAS